MSQLASQMRHRDREMVPKFLVQAMFTLMAVSLALVSFAVWTDRPREGSRAVPPVASERLVTLETTREGAATVRDADGAVIALSTEGTNGFIGVMGRVIQRERLIRDADPTAPVRILRRENGHIAIADTVTPLTVELVGYGADNVASFARLVD